MTIPKSKLGFLLAAVYIFIAGLIFIYAKFACVSYGADVLYCTGIKLYFALPFILIVSPISIIPAYTDSVITPFYFISILFNIILFYFIGSIIQKKSKENTVKIISYVVIAIALLAVIEVGYKFYNKPDFIKFSHSTDNNYCQQDSDCILASQDKGFCPGCGVAEAVNIETKNKEEEAQDNSINIKKYICPTYKCATFVGKQAVCEQNQCVVKEKTSVQTKLQEFEVRQIADAYAKTQGYNLSEYQAPEITYDSKTNEWYLFYDQVYPPRNEMSGTPGKHFSVYIDDTTGEVFRLIPGA